MSTSKNTSTSISTISTTQPISLIGTMGLMQNPQQIHNISLLQKQQQQLAAFQTQQRASPQLVTNVRPVVNVVGNQPTVATLQNIQVLGKSLSKLLVRLFLIIMVQNLLTDKEIF